MQFSELNQKRILWLLSEATDQRRGTHQILHPTLAAANPLTIQAVVHKGNAEMTCMINDVKLFYPDTMAFRVFIELKPEEKAVIWPTMYKDDDIGIMHGCYWEGMDDSETPVSSNHYELTLNKIELMLDTMWRRYQLPKHKEESCTNV